MSFSYSVRLVKQPIEASLTVDRVVSTSHVNRLFTVWNDSTCDESASFLCQIYREPFDLSILSR